MTDVISGVGASAAVGGVGGGIVYSINNLSTTPQQILPIDPGRRRIIVHNPGAINAYWAPAQVQGTGSDVTLVPSPSALGGCFVIFASGGTLTIDGECQKAWQAFSASGSGNPLTVQVSRI
jgi:hypothetical protein